MGPKGILKSPIGPFLTKMAYSLFVQSSELAKKNVGSNPSIVPSRQKMPHVGFQTWHCHILPEIAATLASNPGIVLSRQKLKQVGFQSRHCPVLPEIAATLASNGMLRPVRNCCSLPPTPPPLPLQLSDGQSSEASWAEQYSTGKILRQMCISRGS